MREVNWLSARWGSHPKRNLYLAGVKNNLKNLTCGWGSHPEGNLWSRSTGKEKIISIDLYSGKLLPPQQQTTQQLTRLYDPTASPHVKMHNFLLWVYCRKTTFHTVRVQNRTNSYFQRCFLEVNGSDFKIDFFAGSLTTWQYIWDSFVVVEEEEEKEMLWDCPRLVDDDYYWTRIIDQEFSPILLLYKDLLEKYVAKRKLHISFDLIQVNFFSLWLVAVAGGFAR